MSGCASGRSSRPGVVGRLDQPATNVSDAVTIRCMSAGSIAHLTLAASAPLRRVSGPRVLHADLAQDDCTSTRPSGRRRSRPTSIARKGDAARPCLVWIHGGALIMGSREGVPRRSGRAVPSERLCARFARLSPGAGSASCRTIIEDIKDAFRWIADEGAARFGIDPRADRRCRRIGRRLPDDDDRHLRRAAAQGAGGLLGLR